MNNSQSKQSLPPHGTDDNALSYIPLWFTVRLLSVGNFWHVCLVCAHIFLFTCSRERNLSEIISLVVVGSHIHLFPLFHIFLFSNGCTLGTHSPIYKHLRYYTYYFAQTIANIKIVFDKDEYLCNTLVHF